MNDFCNKTKTQADDCDDDNDTLITYKINMLRGEVFHRQFTELPTASPAIGGDFQVTGNVLFD